MGGEMFRTAAKFCKPYAVKPNPTNRRKGTVAHSCNEPLALKSDILHPFLHQSFRWDVPKFAKLRVPR
jgi:hypothetical protein